jgi:DNA-binding CsgD family transcriptional regulator
VSPGGDPLVERDAELVILAEAFTEARAGRGTALLLEGEAGIGKTTLLAAACDAARDEGPRLLRAQGTPLDETVAYGVARQLVLPALLDGGDEERLLRGAASLARPALLGADGAGPPLGDAAFAIREGLTWLMATMARDAGPLALIVDDAHWADGASVRFLQALAGRIEELPVALVLAARPGAAWMDPGLAAELAAAFRVVRPARLSSRGVGTALARRLHAAPAAEFAAAAHAQTAGTPYLVAALADALEREGIEPTADRVAAVDRLGAMEVGRSVAARIRGLSPEARAIGRAVAVLGDGRPATEAERLAGLEPGASARAAAALEATGLVRGWPEPSFDHPLVRAAVLDDLGAPERSLLHERAADLAIAAGEFERASAHLAEVPGRSSPERAELLHRVGMRALHRGAPGEAIRHLRRALAEPPPDAARGQVLFDLGVSELTAGDSAAPDRLVAAADATSSPDVRIRALGVAGHALTFIGRWTEGFEVMKAAIAGAGDAHPDAVALARLELAGWMLTCIETGREASAMLDALDLEVGTDTPLRPLLEGVLALRDVTCGLPRDGVLLRVQSAAAGALPEHSSTPVQGMPLVALVLADAFNEAAASLKEVIAVARSRLDLTMVRILSAWLAMSHARRGMLAEAEETALAVHEGEGPAPALVEPLAAIVLASVALERGDVRAAAGWADRPYEDDPRIRETNFCDYVLVARGRVRLAEGAAGDAYRLFAQAGRSQTRWIGASPPTTQWRTYLALAANALGRRAEARGLLEEEVPAAERFGAPRPLAAALRARATVLAGVGAEADAERSLRDAADVLGGSPDDLERARVGADLGDLLLRQGRAEAARELLRPALDLAWACGADALAERARASLVEAGARPRRPELTGARALTPAEARTARMAAEGVTNRELAEALFVTEKTVETHLTAVYRKLNIAGRPQLAAALGQPQGVGVQKTGVPSGGGAA